MFCCFKQKTADEMRISDWSSDGCSSYLRNMAIAAKLEDLGTRVDDLGKPAWIALVVLGFIAFWPAGLAILFYLVWSGRMACWKNSGNGSYRGLRKRWSGWSTSPSSGHHDFAEYRAATLPWLAEEER